MELEGLKLEMTIFESRLLSVTSKSDNESVIKSLRVKLKDLEAVIRHQDELTKTLLNEDNSFFKSKLSSIENFMLEVIHNVNQENNVNDPSPINVEIPSADKTPVYLNRNNIILTENNDRGPAISVIDIPAETTPCNGAQLENLNINNVSPINIEISSAVKTPARMNENNASSRTIEIPSSKKLLKAIVLTQAKRKKH